MNELWKTSLWLQFGAAIDMLDDAIEFCPEPLWTAMMWEDADDSRYGQPWFIAYHTVFWLDLQLTGSPEGFVPPAPFIRGVIPDKPYTKDEIRSYLRACRKRCQTTIEELTDERAQQLCHFEWADFSFLELLMYSMRHVQEHSSQLHMLLGSQKDCPLDWVSKARS